MNDQSRQPHVVKAVGGIADLAAKLTQKSMEQLVLVILVGPLMANQLSPMHIPMFQAINAALVHNGVIENLEELKEQFLSG